jgi:hypothetical protein
MVEDVLRYKRLDDGLSPGALDARWRESESFLHC